MSKRTDIDNWQRARLIAYIAGKPYFGKMHQNLTVYEFLPLPGDPTKEQIAEIKKEQQNLEAKQALEMINYYEEMGIIGKS